MGAVSLKERAERKEPMIVSCYVEGRGDVWEGVCLDFDLAVHGQSFNEVSRKLDTAIQEYVSYARSLPEEDCKRLLTRHVPLSVTLKFMAQLFVTWLFRSRGGGSNGKHWNAYTIPCSA